MKIDLLIKDTSKHKSIKELEEFADKNELEMYTSYDGAMFYVRLKRLRIKQDDRIVPTDMGVASNIEDAIINYINNISNQRLCIDLVEVHNPFKRILKKTDVTISDLNSFLDKNKNIISSLKTSIKVEISDDYHDSHLVKCTGFELEFLHNIFSLVIKT